MALRQVLCRFARRGSQASTVFARSVEFVPAPALPRFPSRSTLLIQGMQQVPPSRSVSALRRIVPELASESSLKIQARKMSNMQKVLGSINASWEVVFEAVVKVLKKKFPQKNNSYVLGLLDRITTDYLERGSDMVLSKIRSLLNAAFWAISGCVILGWNVSMKNGIRMIYEQKTEGGDIIEAMKKELKKFSEEEDERFDSLKKQSASEFKEVKQEVNLCRISIDSLPMRIGTGLSTENMPTRAQDSPDGAK